jgi:hypothetical protein
VPDNLPPGIMTRGQHAARAIASVHRARARNFTFYVQSRISVSCVVLALWISPLRDPQSRSCASEIVNSLKHDGPSLICAMCHAMGPVDVLDPLDGGSLLEGLKQISNFGAR